MDLSIVVVSYNTRDLTLDCLASVSSTLAYHPSDCSVWVVDNVSSDGSIEAISARYPAVNLVANSDNLGFAGGVNVALERMASTDPPRYVLLLNPDTLVEPSAIPEMLSFLERHPRVGAVGAQLCHGDGSFQHSAFRFPSLLMAFLDFWPIHHSITDSRLNGRYPRRQYQRGEPFPIDHPLGAALMIRWATIAEVGPLDTDFFMYCEEIDWCMRIKAAGWGIYCVPTARITHFVAQSTRQFREEMLVALWRSRYRLFAKHYGALYRRGIKLIVQAGMRRELARTHRARQRGLIEERDAGRRIDAYRRVMEL